MCFTDVRFLSGREDLRAVPGGNANIAAGLHVLCAQEPPTLRPQSLRELRVERLRATEVTKNNEKVSVPFVILVLPTFARFSHEELS
jgi:hypothetical protein